MPPVSDEVRALRQALSVAVADAWPHAFAGSIVAVMIKSNAALLRRAASEFGRLGGKARAKALSPEQRKRIARQAAQARWGRTPEAR